MDIVYIDDKTGLPCPEAPIKQKATPRKVDLFLTMNMVLDAKKERRHFPLKKSKPIPVDIDNLCK